MSLNTQTTTTDWQDCLNEAIAFYQSCLDKAITDHQGTCNHPTCTGSQCSRPPTARHYFEVARSWNEEGIHSAKLGYAPPDTSLISHLNEKGFTPATIRATGLVTEDLRPLWKGRYVFPYLDVDGRAIYAISRSTAPKGGNEGHPKDFISGKYGNLAHTKSYSKVRQAPYGLHTIQEGTPILIAEGIADAITAHQAGWPCISPVGTHFSREIFPRVVEHLWSFEVPRIYVLADSDVPGSTATESGDLQLDRAGTGIEGAFQTASQFVEEGFDTRLSIIPRIGRDDIDLDEFLTEDWGSIDTLVRGGKPPQVHPISRILNSTSSQPTSSFTAPEPSAAVGGSHLYELTLKEILGWPIGERGSNPISHTGSRTDYFHLREEDRAHDYKADATYHARTYLLCEAGERDVRSPEGHLSNREVFVAWKTAKQNGYLPSEDPIPSRALAHIAVTEGLCQDAAVENGWKLPDDTYNQTLELIESAYGFETGRKPTEPADERRDSPLVGEKTEPSDSSNSDGSGVESGEQDILESARNRCSEAVSAAIDSGEGVLIDALPAMGKSASVSRAVEQSDIPVTILTARTDLYTQHAQWCEETGLEYHLLPGFHRDCPTAAGEHGNDWSEKVLELYERGVSAGALHRFWSTHSNKSLPCLREGRCEYQAGWDFNPDEYDVLIGHYTHAYRTDAIADRVVVFDEAPWSEFVHEVPSEVVWRSVSTLLSRVANAPFADGTEVIERRIDVDVVEEAREWCEAEGLEMDHLGVLQNNGAQAHASAPLLLYALLTAEDLGNGWERSVIKPDSSDSERIIVVRDRSSNDMYLLKPPTLESATGVVGLEGLSSPPLWELALDRSFHYQQVLTNEERGQFLQEGLGLSIIQTAPKDVHAYSSGNWVHPTRDEALIRAVARRQDTEPAIISTRRALQQYDREGILDHVGASEHYGNLTGSNQFEGEPVGIVIGCQHYGDGYVEKWGALEGEAITRSGSGLDLDYGAFGNSVLHHMREDQVLQAVLRFARGTNDATVYVHTAALPEWLPVGYRGSVHSWSDTARAIVETLQDDGRKEWKTAEVADLPRIDVSERQVRNVLQNLTEAGQVDRTKVGRGYRWALQTPSARETGCNQVGWLDLEEKP